MNVRRGLWVVAGAVLLVFGILGGLRFLKKEAPSTQAEGVRNYIQKRGEEGIKRRTALSLAAVYERMLAQFPDNLELKKKLAAAYTEAGRPEKAKPLLDEISRREQEKPSLR